ncbi:unnamed protein product [Linum tenue]|uniref:K Homology domain-containing protein n=1 Tax=Linum tenue TaxID=586396 RepID=A0AAV0JK93_9ROSI|nr:unnamed protein product [Linum tenue]
MDSPSNLSKFRILCPSARTGAVIGKGGSSVRHIQTVTGAKIRLLDNPHGHPPCDERVILISHVNNPFSGATANNRNPRPTAAEETTAANENSNSSSSHPPDSGGAVADGSSAVGVKSSGGESGGGGGDEGWGPVQKALVRVFEKIVKGDSLEELSEEVVVVGRVLIGNDQAAHLFGRGGNVLDKIMAESGAHQVRLLPREQIPPCASLGDELMLVTGSYYAVRRALLAFYSCLEDISKAEAANPGSAKHSGHHGHADFSQRGYADYHSRGHSPNMGAENFDGRNGRVVEEDVVFKLLCQLDKVGSLIGKGGSVIKTLQNDTGASIKIADVMPVSQERIVVISARENSEQRRSPAQDGVIRVQTRIAEIGYEHGAPVVARLIVHSQQIGRLLGKGGQIISEMRHLTGAHIRIFPTDQAAKHGTPHDEIVQVIGNLQCVQDALYHITGRLRDIIFPPVKSSFSNSGGPPPYQSQFSDMPPPQFRPRPHPASTGPYPSPAAGPYHGTDHPAVPPHHQDHHSFPYGDERPGHGPPFEISPRSWNNQQVRYSFGQIGNNLDVHLQILSLYCCCYFTAYSVAQLLLVTPFLSFALFSSHLTAAIHMEVLMGTQREMGLQLGDPRFPRTVRFFSKLILRGVQAPGGPVEMVIPLNFLSHVHGENNSNLNQIRQISGASILIQEPKAGGGDVVVGISGTSHQIHTAQCLIHAFIMTGRSDAA